MTTKEQLNQAIDHLTKRWKSSYELALKYSSGTLAKMSKEELLEEIRKHINIGSDGLVVGADVCQKILETIDDVDRTAMGKRIK